MKNFCKTLLVVAIACCMLLSVACGEKAAPAAATAAPAAAEAPALERYDYVADMSGNSVNFTIATNLKSVKIAITSMGLELTAYCTVEDNVLTLTEKVEGNDQFFGSLSKTPYVLNPADGTATPKQ